MKNILILLMAIIALYSCNLEETENISTLEYLFFEQADEGAFNVKLINGIPDENKKEVYYTDFSTNKEEWYKEELVNNGKYPLIFDKKGYYQTRLIDISRIGTDANFEIQFNIEFSELKTDSRIGFVFNSKEDSESYNTDYNVWRLSNLLDNDTQLKLLHIDGSDKFLTRHKTNIKGFFSSGNWSGKITVRKFNDYLYLFIDDELASYVKIKDSGVFDRDIKFYGNLFGFTIVGLTNTWLLNYRVSEIVTPLQD